MRFLLLLALPLSSISPPSLEAAELSPSVEACRTARAEAWEALRYDRLWKKPKGPSEAAHRRFLRVADQCMAASETATSRLDSAYLVAESAICKAIYEHYAGYWEKNRRPEIEKQALREGIDLVYRLDGERSPALLELLDRISTLEWIDNPKEASGFLEQRIEIARLAYGETDPRYAEVLMKAALKYEPYDIGGDRKIRGADDAGLAEQHYRTALKVFAKDPLRMGSEIYRELLSMMQFFYEGEGREKEARNLERILDEIQLEVELDERLAEPGTDGTLPREEGEAAATTPAGAQEASDDPESSPDEGEGV